MIATQSRWTPAALVIGLGMLAVVTVGCGRAGTNPAGPHFVVATANVGFAMRGADTTLAVLKDLPADVIVLQEVTPDWQAYLASRLEGKYPHQLYRTDELAGGLAVLSRWELTDVKVARPPKARYPAWIVRGNTPIGPVVLVQVHLQPGVDEKNRSSLSAYLATGAQRLAELKYVYGQCDPAANAIVLGSLNENDGGDALDFLRTKGFTDALSIYDKLTNTVRMPAGPLVGVRPDHVMFSKNLRCPKAWVGPWLGSGRRPVVAAIQLQPATLPPGAATPAP